MNAQPALFASHPLCITCSDLGYWVEPGGSVTRCPSIVMQRPHNEPGPAQTIVARAIARLKRESRLVDAQHFVVLRYLVAFNGLAPCPRTELLERFFLYIDGHLARQRKFHALIEDLRKIWLLPVGSRKEQPSGYWIITELPDFKEWYARATAAPVTQLTTLHRLAKHNFPIFAEQIELDFFGNIESAAGVSPAGVDLSGKKELTNAAA